MSTPLYETDFPGLTLLKRGKVRDIYDSGDSLLIVATDRISAFDVVLPDPIPDKGKVLTRISLFWFDRLASIVPNHLITADVARYPEACRPYAAVLRGRSMLVRKAEPLPVECVVRGYLSGSGWRSYRETGRVCGLRLPEGLVESAPLPEPVFTPSTKAEQGRHDENIDFETAAALIGPESAARVRDLSLALYRHGVRAAAAAGIIIADTKFEFGLLDGELILIDEVLTPDSSRFWPAENYRPGGPPRSFDKQYLRDYLLTLDWDRSPPGPSLPEAVVARTRAKYLDALKRLVGVDHAL